MKFGTIPVEESVGAILAHAVRAPGLTLRKGHVVADADLVDLRRAGLPTVVAARLEAGEVAEDAAAHRLARALSGPNVRAEAPFTGRCNLISEVDGLFHVSPAIVDAVNAIDEGLTVATLPLWQPVKAGEMIATVKIIPFAVAQARLDAVVAAAVAPLTVRPFRPQRVAVVSTLLPGLKPSTIGKTLQALEARLHVGGSAMAAETRVPHDAAALARALTDLPPCDLVVVFGASAITDRRDVIPAAVERAGGAVEHLGMPVDPGNLLLLARLPGGVPLIGAPGCARSPKENGFDFVLRRLMTGEMLRSADLRRMGVGGLLNEIASRPQRRQLSEAE